MYTHRVLTQLRSLEQMDREDIPSDSESKARDNPTTPTAVSNGLGSPNSTEDTKSLPSIPSQYQISIALTFSSKLQVRVLWMNCQE